MAASKSKTDTIPDVKPPQLVMGACWTGMGLACVVAPGTVLSLSLRPEYLPEAGTNVEKTVQLLMQCFGAQAVMTGISLLSNPMSAKSAKIWTGGLVPFVVFDYVFWARGMLTDFGAGGDLAGNIVFAACSAALM